MKSQYMQNLFFLFYICFSCYFLYTGNGITVNTIQVRKPTIPICSHSSTSVAFTLKNSLISPFFYYSTATDLVFVLIISHKILPPDFLPVFPLICHSHLYITLKGQSEYSFA